MKTNKERFITEFMEDEKLIEISQTYKTDESVCNDILTIKDSVDGMSACSMTLIEWLYFCFSHHEYCASWMLMDTHILTEFTAWLRSDKVRFE